MDDAAQLGALGQPLHGSGPPRTRAPAWPGLDKEPEELRRGPSPLRGLGITEVGLFFNPKAATKVDYKNPARAPLLLATGAEDRICPPSVNQANFKQQRKAPSATDHKEFPGRSHFPGQDGWDEVADFVLNWAVDHTRAGERAAAEGAPARAPTSPV